MTIETAEDLKIVLDGWLTTTDEKEPAFALLPSRHGTYCPIEQATFSAMGGEIDPSTGCEDTILYDSVEYLVGYASRIEHDAMLQSFVRRVDSARELSRHDAVTVGRARKIWQQLCVEYAWKAKESDDGRTE